jgi:hypothetical protein
MSKSCWSSFKSIFVAAKARDIELSSQTVVFLGIYRIAASALALIDVFELLQYHRHFFGLSDGGIIVNQGAIAPGLLLIWAASLSMLLLGYRTRLFALIHYLFTILFLSTPLFDRVSYAATHDQVLRMHAFLLLVLPVGRSLSVDMIVGAFRRAAICMIKISPPKCDPNLGTLFGYLIGMFYFDSAMWKIFDPMWTAGLGLWTGATLPNLLINPVPLTDQRLLMQVFGYGVIAFELLFLPVFYFKHMRCYLIIVGLFFHISLIFFYPFLVFSLAMVVLYIPLLPEMLPKTKYKTSKLIEYNSSSPLDCFVVNLLALSPTSTELTFHSKSSSEIKENITWTYLRRYLNHDFTGVYLRLVLPKTLFHSLEKRLNGITFTDQPQKAKEGDFYDHYIYQATAGLYAFFFVVLLPLTFPGVATSTTGRRITSLIKHSVYPLTGLRSRQVFSNTLFQDNDHQITLIYTNGNDEWEFPFYKSPSGFYSIRMTDRTWEHWWKRTQGGFLSIGDTKKNLERWSDFFASENCAEEGRIVIKARRQTVLTTHWIENLLQKNTDAAWKAIGYLIPDENCHWKLFWKSKRVYDASLKTNDIISQELTDNSH